MLDSIKKVAEMEQGDEEVKKRVAFVLIDGLGDVSIPKLGYKTPLQAANIPNLDAIASAGINGLMDPVEVGLGCGSDTAHLSLMGYDPRVYYRGRGAFESMGAGRRADRHFEEEGPILCAALDGMKLPSFPEYEVRVRYATEHRCGVVVKGPKLSGNISGTDPLKDNRLLLQAKPLDESEEANHTANVVNELSKEISRILVTHPVNAKRLAQGKNIANLVLLRGCGIRIEVPPFEEKHGLWPCMVAPTKIIAGLGMSLGIDILEAPGATGDYRTLLTSKAVAIANALSAPLSPCPNVFVPGEDGHKPGRSGGYDFGFLHIKAIDDAGHDKATMFKVKGLEAVDKAIRQLAKLLWQAESCSDYQYFLCVTGDHSTPVEYGDHSFEPVPFTMCRLREFVSAVGGESALLETSLEPFPLPTVVECGEDVAGKEEDGGRKETPTAVGGDSVAELSEIAAARGCLGRFHGGEMMGVITKFLKLEV
ncbi:hypothetical protein HID58_023720 [Brassica napus]|uniref:Metalloenzyme domain-containing protein n=1 Tax=Brassica napus TaxID=3708 RepID=A0ABQ8D2W1_BRANA|nr:hypothetical protein HID58_023720 [Brassica napus]